MPLYLPRPMTVEVALLSAPRAISSLIASPRLAAAAYISAFSPQVFSLALTSAPWSSSSLIAATLPELAASINTVVPVSLVSLALAPALRRRSIMGALPRCAAR